MSIALNFGLIISQLKEIYVFYNRRVHGLCRNNKEYIETREQDDDW